MKKPKTKIIEIDASGKILGRLSTQIAVELRGKKNPKFRPYINGGSIVNVTNASKIVLTGNKLEQKKYYSHSGYLGHLKEITAKQLMKENPSKIIEKSVYGMLPTNKLRKLMMKNLRITD